MNDKITNTQPKMMGARIILKLLIPALLIAIISDSELNFRKVIVVAKYATKGIIAAVSLGIINIVRFMNDSNVNPLRTISSTNLRDCASHTIPINEIIIRTNGPISCLKIYNEIRCKSFSLYCYSNLINIFAL